MKKLIVANWKCNPTSLKEAQKMLLQLRSGIKKTKAEVVICPPFCYLPLVSYKMLNVKLGAQNCFWEQNGPFTGEISAQMLKDLAVQYVILGHSERIMILGETNAMIAKKVKAVLNSGLMPIICVGETLEEKEQGKTFQVIEKALREILQGIKKQQMEKVIIAYEPLWAISTNQNNHKNCSPDDALTMALYIKKLASEIFGKKAIQTLRVLYGGSVNVKNALYYLNQDAISGLLVGGASLNIKEFLGILSLI